MLRRIQLFQVPRLAVGLVVLAVLSATSRDVWAHGLHGHVHVTGWAIENLPPGELHDMFQDPDVFQAALSGAMFPDTGYATDAPGARDYGEAAHWEPFIEPFIQHVRAIYGPTYETKEEKMLVAFLLGCAAHGLQDELFDSTFLFEVEERDGPGQEITDPATDGFLFLDGFFRLLPGGFFPIDEVLPLFSVLNRPIDHALIADQIRIVRDGYVNGGLGARIATGYGRRYRSFIPWTSDHYLDPGVAGSLAAEVKPTGRHMQALWERLHDNFDEERLVVHAWPEGPRRLRSGTRGKVASWITLVLGKGIEEGSASASLIDAAGDSHPFQLRYTRWGGTSRLVRIQPTEDLLPGATYTVLLNAGARLVDGSQTRLVHEHQFRVECTAENEGECEPVVVSDDPIIAGAPSTATPTGTPSATTTVTPTATSEPSHTATEIPTTTVTATATSTASATFSPTSTMMPSLSPTATSTSTATPSTIPTTTATPTSTGTTTPTLSPTVRVQDDDGSCQMHGVSRATPSSLAYLWFALAWIGARRRRRPFRNR